MAKCPWCENNIVVYKDGWFFYHRCKDKCYRSNQPYKTPDKALAAASKRFMPMVDGNGVVTEVRCG